MASDGPKGSQDCGGYPTGIVARCESDVSTRLPSAVELASSMAQGMGARQQVRQAYRVLGLSRFRTPGAVQTAENAVYAGVGELELGNLVHGEEGPALSDVPRSPSVLRSRPGLARPGRHSDRLQPPEVVLRSRLTGSPAIRSM